MSTAPCRKSTGELPAKKKIRDNTVDNTINPLEPDRPIVFIATVVRCPSLGELNIQPGITLVVSPTSGTIERCFEADESETVEAREIVANAEANGTLTRLGPGDFLLPGFVDCHIHAPQYAYTGTGLDLPLMGPDGWLERYTFPSERSLGSDRARGEAVYERCVGRTLTCGTTTALYFGTLALAPTANLAATMLRLGQRGFAGKVCMDRNAPGDYSDSTEANIEDSGNTSDCSMVPRLVLIGTVGVAS